MRCNGAVSTVQYITLVLHSSITQARTFRRRLGAGKEYNNECVRPTLVFKTGRRSREDRASSLTLHPFSIYSELLVSQIRVDRVQQISTGNKAWQVLMQEELGSLVHKCRCEAGYERQRCEFSVGGGFHPLDRRQLVNKLTSLVHVVRTNQSVRHIPEF